MDFIVGFSTGFTIGLIMAGVFFSGTKRAAGDHDMVELELLRMAIERGDPKPELLLRVTDMMADKNQGMPSGGGE